VASNEEISWLLGVNTIHKEIICTLGTEQTKLQCPVGALAQMKTVSCNVKYARVAGRCYVTVGRQVSLAAASLCFIPVKAAPTDCVSDNLILFLYLLFGLRLGPHTESHGNKNGNLLYFATVT
jgi:hypothetical protein